MYISPALSKCFCLYFSESRRVWGWSNWAVWLTCQNAITETWQVFCLPILNGKMVCLPINKSRGTKKFYQDCLPTDVVLMWQHSTGFHLGFTSPLLGYINLWNNFVLPHHLPCQLVNNLGKIYWRPWHYSFANYGSLTYTNQNRFRNPLNPLDQLHWD